MSAEVDRKRAYLREFNELIRCEKAEANQKHDTAFVLRNKSNDDLTLKLSAVVDRKEETCTNPTIQVASKELKRIRKMSQSNML